jgi:hypothetical protein
MLRHCELIVNDLNLGQTEKIVVFLISLPVLETAVILKIDERVIGL